jgi:hypothetical protein
VRDGRPAGLLGNGSAGAEPGEHGVALGHQSLEHRGACFVVPELRDLAQHRGQPTVGGATNRRDLSVVSGRDGGGFGFELRDPTLQRPERTRGGEVGPRGAGRPARTTLRRTGRHQ